MSLEEELAQMRADFQRLQAENAALKAALAAAEQRIAELEAKKTPPAPFVKANVPQRPKQPRKPRARTQPRPPPGTPDPDRRASPGALSGVPGAVEWGASGAPPPGGRRAAPATCAGHGASRLHRLVFVLSCLARGPTGLERAGAGPEPHRRRHCQSGGPPAPGGPRAAAHHPSLVGKRTCSAPLGGRDQRPAAARGGLRATGPECGARADSRQSGGAGR